MPAKTTTIKDQVQELAYIKKELKALGLAKKLTKSEKTAVLKKIEALQVELRATMTEERMIEGKIEEVVRLEKTAPVVEKAQIEKQRGTMDAERRRFEKIKWQIRKKIERAEAKIVKIEQKDTKLLEKEKRLEEKKKEVLREKSRKKLANERTRLKDKILALVSEKRKIREKQRKFSDEESRVEGELEDVLEKERIAWKIIQDMEDEERIVSSPQEKRKIEETRWEAEDNRALIEQEKWKLEEKAKKLFLGLKKTRKQYEETLIQEKVLREKIEEISDSIEMPLSETGKKKDEGHAQAEAQAEVEVEGEKAEVLMKAPAQTIKSVKKPGFFTKLFNRAMSYSKTRQDIRKIKEFGVFEEKQALDKETKKAKEEKRKAKQEKHRQEEELKRNKALEMQREVELEKRRALRKEAEKRQTEALRGQKKELAKQYEQELMSQRKRLVEQHEKQLREKKLAREEQEQKIIQSQEIIRERYIPYVPDRLVKQQELVGQLKEEEKKLEKQHKIELSEQAEALIHRRKKELIRQEEKIIRIQQEELQRDESSEHKIQKGIGQKKEEKIELTVEEKQRKREDLAIRRKAIQMEVQRMEQEELRIRRLKEEAQEDIARREREKEKEKEKKKRAEEFSSVKQEKVVRDSWVAPTKDIFLSAEEILIKEREDKELQSIFSSALEHYNKKELDEANTLFLKVQEQAIEPAKELGFFAKILNKAPLYIEAEKYLKKIASQKVVQEKRALKMIRRQAKEEAKKKTQKNGKKKEDQIALIGNQEWEKPSSLRNIFDSFKEKITFHHPIVGIDISEHSIEILHLSRQRSILTYGRTVIKDGIIRDGRVKDQKALATALGLTMKRAGFRAFDPRKGPSLKAIVSIPGSQTYIQVLTLNAKSNFPEIVRQEIEKTIPFPINDLYWSYSKIGDESQDKVKVIYAATPKDIIDNRIHFLKALGIIPIVFDIEAISLGRALLSGTSELNESDKENIKEGIMILDIGARISNLSIFDKNGLIGLSVTIPYAGFDFVLQVADSLNISREKAEAMIEEKGLENADSFLPILKESMEEIIKETQQSMDHYLRESGKGVGKIILTGGFFLFPGIDNFFQSCFKEVEIEIGNPLKTIKRKGGLKKERAILYSNVIGLALRCIAKNPAKSGLNLLSKSMDTNIE